MENAERLEDQSRAGTDGRWKRGRVLVLPAALFAIVLWGGYSRKWSWTGINGSTATLWDWLHLLALPIAVATLPLWLSRKTRVTPGHKRLGYSALGLFVLVVVIGYTAPWGWTGFSGNTLWDWLELLALPLAVALAPVYRELRKSWTPWHSLIAYAGLTIFTVVVLGGYFANWGWTGFKGNTLWDWLHLLLLPLLLPAVVVPAMMPKVKAGVTLVPPAQQPAPPSETQRSADGEPAPPAGSGR